MKSQGRLNVRTSCLVLVTLTVSVSVGVGVGVAPTQAGATAPRPSPPAAVTVSPARTPASTLGAGYYRSFDVAVTGTGDAGGYHLSYALEREGFAWRSLATVLPVPGLDTQWVGQQCLTGDGTQTVAVVAPADAANDPAAKGRGAYAYAVSVPSGNVRLLAADVSLAYYDPGCGAGHRVVLTRELGDLDSGHQSTELLSVDARTGKTVSDQKVVGAQLTSAVPASDGSVVAAEASHVVRVAGSKTRLLATAPGTAFSLVPRADGRVDLLAATGNTATLEEVTGTGAMTALGSGPLTKARLMVGRAGDATAVNVAGPARAGLRRLTDKIAPTGDSLEGDILTTVVSAKPKASAANPTAAPTPTTIETLASATGRTSQTATPDVPATPTPDTTASRAPNDKTASPAASAHSTSVATSAATAPTGGTPTCSVPRDDPSKQVTQPARQQVEWTADQAVRNNLAGTRPAGWHNDGLASYSPQGTDLPRHMLTGYTSTAIPPQVLLGVLAQESNMDQASFHALPGIAGNPNVADYYGAAGGLSTINYAASDCGYGIGQVTTGMKASDTSPYSTNGKTKIAIDYWENIAAAQQILADKWNQLAALSPSTVFNGGDPQYVENWYGALWAYNTSVHTPADAQGQFGLGWTNNPINPDYPPNRAGFLRTSYADAATPANWPYQERVLGWAETAQLDYTGASSYATPTYASSDSAHQLYLPPVSTFCTVAVNDCDPSYQPGHGAPHNTVDYCEEPGRNCYWHGPANWVSTSPSGTCANYCATGTYTYATSATEPALTDPHPADCNSSLPSNAVIVDDEPSVASGQAGLNIVGCSAVNWTSAGTFALTYGTDSNGVPLSVIDTHQLGAAFGGHEYFTHNVATTDTAHQLTGTWTPTLPATQAYNVEVHIPSTGGTTTSAHYKVTAADGTVTDKVVDQHQQKDDWVSLGYFNLAAGNAKVTLANVTDETSYGTHDVSYDAVGFIPVSGTVVTHTFDAVSLFNANQDINTPNSLAKSDSPLIGMKYLHDWALEYGSSGPSWDGGTNGTHDGIGYYPVCAATPTASCVPQATSTVANNWIVNVNNAGYTTTNHTNNETEPDWMNYASQTPGPATITPSTFSDDGTYKEKTHATFSFLVDGSGKVVPGSPYVQMSTRTGTTHVAQFFLDLVRNISADYKNYGVALPNLSYNEVDANQWSGDATPVDPLTTGLAPGRAYLYHIGKSTVDSTGQCLATRAISGGSIGYRPWLASTAVDNAMQAWVDQVHALTTGANPVAPPAIYDMAVQLQQLFLNPGVTGSLYVQAAPIWQNVAIQMCANGTLTSSAVEPDSTNGNHLTLVQQSFMPDLYLYKDGSPVDDYGNPSSGPVQTGDFASFGAAPNGVPPGFNGPYAYGGCDIYNNGHAGNPWDMNIYVPSNADVRPKYVYFCDAPSQPYGDTSTDG